jgi:hypothetical protein
MLKAVLAGTAALAIAGSTLVYAQQRGDRPEGFRRGAPTTEDMQAFADARLAALKAGLALTPEQQANWPAFEAAARDMQKLRIEGMAARAERRNNPQAQNADPVERIRRQGNAMADRGAALKKLADAVEPLYKSLDDNQKRRFTALSRIADPREAFAARGGRDDDRRFGGRDDRDFRGGRGFRDGPGDRFGGRDFRDGPDFRGERFGGRDFRGGPDFRGDRFGGRDDRDVRGPRGFGRDGDRGFRGREDGPRGFRDGREDFGYEPRGFGRGPRGGDDADDYRRRDDDRRGPGRPGGRRFEREDL